jgi:hypothetical protein
MIQIALLASATTAARADQPAPSETIEARLSAARVQVGQTAIYSVTFPSSGARSLDFPDFGRLTAHGPFQQQRRGPAKPASLVYWWEVTAPEPGTYRIGPVHLKRQADTLTSNRLELVCSGETPASAPATAPYDRKALIQSFYLSRPPVPIATITPSEVAVGEAATYSISLPIQRTHAPREGTRSDKATVQPPAFGELSVTGPVVSSVHPEKRQPDAKEETELEVHSWTVRAAKPGRFDIGATSFTRDGRSGPLNEVSLLVDDGPPRHADAKPGEVLAQTSLDRSVIRAGETAVYAFRVSTDQTGKFRTAPAWGTLQATSQGTESSDEYKYVDGKRTGLHWRGFLWLVIPPRTGRYVIGSPTWTLDGHDYNGPPVTLVVDDAQPVATTPTR